jgi:uncharacterized protein (UPF0335 family)
MTRGRKTNGAHETMQPPLSNSATLKDEIRDGVERILKLKEEMAGIREVVADIKNALKDKGIGKTALNQAIREAEMDGAERSTFQSDLELCREALGMFSDTPLGSAAMERAGA